jgi:hypothetical protein
MANTIGPKSAPHSRALCTPYVTIIGIGFPSITKRKRSNFGAHVYFIRSSYINPQSVYIQRRQPSRTEIDNAARSLLQLRMDLSSRDFATVPVADFVRFARIKLVSSTVEQVAYKSCDRRWSRLIYTYNKCRNCLADRTRPSSRMDRVRVTVSCRR